MICLPLKVLMRARHASPLYQTRLCRDAVHGIWLPAPVFEAITFTTAGGEERGGKSFGGLPLKRSIPPFAPHSEGEGMF